MKSHVILLKHETIKESDFNNVLTEDDNEIYLDYVKNEINNDRFEWWDIWKTVYCPLNDVWYSLILYENSFDCYIRSKRKPLYFHDCIVSYNPDTHITEMLRDIDEYERNSFVLNGEVIVGNDFCYYKNNLDGQFYICELTEYEFNIPFIEWTDNKLKDFKPVKEYDGYLLLNKENEYYIISSCFLKNAFKIEHIPEDDKDAYLLYNLSSTEE